MVRRDSVRCVIPPVIGAPHRQTILPKAVMASPPSVTLSGQTATYYLNFAYGTVAPPAPSTPELALGGDIADTSTPTFVGTAEDNIKCCCLKEIRLSAPARRRQAVHGP